MTRDTPEIRPAVVKSWRRRIVGTSTSVPPFVSGPHRQERHMDSLGISSCPLRAHVDPRALRFSAAATAVVLVVALLTVEIARPLALGLLASQIAVFGFTAFVSVHWSVWAQLFARAIWPRLRAATELE